jgi:WD40 repeat protein
MRLESGIVLTAVATYTKGFVLFGTQGFVSFFERSEDKREPFIEMRRLMLGGIRVDKTAFGAARHDELMPGSSVLGDHSAVTDKEDFEVVASATVMPSEEDIVMVCRSNRILSLPLMAVEQMGTHSASLTEHSTGSRGSNHLDTTSVAPSASPLTNVFFGGGHVDKVVGLDIAGQRPVAATISMDASFRLWDFEALRCELVHEFRSDDVPLALSIHYSGFQVLISFKDRVRLFNILQNKLKQFREVPIKNCKEVRFSNGGHLWAAASTLTVLVYDSKNFQQLYTFQGHMMSVKKLLWGPSDAMLFSAGMDGCVYGWLIGTEARVDVLTSSSRYVEYTFQIPSYRRCLTYHY